MIGTETQMAMAVSATEPSLVGYPPEADIIGLRSSSPEMPPLRLVTFGRSDPLCLTERYAALYGTQDTHFCWGPYFRRPPPSGLHVVYPKHLVDLLPAYDEVFCGTGATMFEALLAGCNVFVISSPELAFAEAFSTPIHYDHSLKPVSWTKQGVLQSMFKEIRDGRN